MSPRVTCKVCRRLRFSVCDRQKCAFKRKPYPPGIHGSGRKVRRGGRPTASEYGTQLAEKQKVKFLYGLRERQFKNLVSKASLYKGKDTTKRIIELLESRLDNIVFRLGFTQSRASSRQLVNHGHIMVGSRSVTIPSYQVKVGENIHIRPKSQSSARFRDLDLYLKKYEPPSWLSLDKNKKEGRLVIAPKADEINIGVNLNVIIEFYSR